MHCTKYNQVYILCLHKHVNTYVMFSPFSSIFGVKNLNPIRTKCDLIVSGIITLHLLKYPMFVSYISIPRKHTIFSFYYDILFCFKSKYTLLYRCTRLSNDTKITDF